MWLPCGIASCPQPLHERAYRRAHHTHQSGYKWTDRATLRQGMFIHMPLVSTVKMPVMQIVDVTFVFDGGVSAA